MSSNYYLPSNLNINARALMFVDGENLVMRYQDMIKEGSPSQAYINHETNVFVWSSFANVVNHRTCEITIKYYYTSVTGGTERVPEIVNRLKEQGIEAPRVFHKSKGAHVPNVWMYRFVLIC